MPHATCTKRSDRRALAIQLATLAFLTVPAPGCGREDKIEYKSVSEPLAVRLTHPQRRKITRIVGQPSFVEAYERTSIYPKLTAYVEKWFVDIGDMVSKGDVLATLYVPEIVEDYGTKKATVKLDEQRVELANKLVDVAAADVEAAQAHLEEAQAILADYQAQVDRWQIQTDRLARETKRGVVDPQVLTETQNQLKASTAKRNEAQATISRAKAELLSRKASLAKAKVDVGVANADLAVAQSEERRMAAWVSYLKLYAPFDGIIVTRNANTEDFVLPATGDPSADPNSPHLGPGGRSAPVYVVDRLDIVRVFVDIPEADADYVKEGTKATVLIRAYRDEEIAATVTRTSWGLNVTSRTLRAEIDLHNPNAQIRPGMYAYGKVVIERPGVRALPLEAVFGKGDRTFCWMYRNGKAQRSEIETGVSDGKWIEVMRRRAAAAEAASSDFESWQSFDGSEQVILGDLENLTDGEAVQIAASQAGRIAPSEGNTRVGSEQAKSLSRSP